MQYLTYDVFTKQKYTGNPLAILPNYTDFNDKKMLKIAQEFNLSETIFIAPKENEHYKVRIFTPANELPFAGHPTVGAAIAIARAEVGNDFTGEHHIILTEKAGKVSVKVTLADDGDYAEFIAPKTPKPCPIGLTNHQVAEILSLNKSDIGFDTHLPSLYDAGNLFFCFPIASRHALKNIEINLQKATEYIPIGLHRAFYCYCLDKQAASDFSTRMFSLDLGMNEDAATGSAATSFAGALAVNLSLEDGIHAFKLDQGVDMGRASEISLHIVMRNRAIEQVRVGGHAILMSKGEFV